MPAQVQRCVVCDLLAVGQDEFVNVVAVFGEGPARKTNYNQCQHVRVRAREVKGMKTPIKIMEQIVSQ